MKDFILGLKLLKYGYRVKLNIIMLVCFFVAGIIMEACTHGKVLTGGFYFMIIGMFAYQLIMSLDISEYVQSTAFKRKLQITIPTIVSTVGYLLIFTILIIERIFLLKAYPEEGEAILFSLCSIVVMMFVTFIFTSICYKFFVLGFVIFAVLLAVSSTLINFFACHGGVEAVGRMGIVPVAIGGYAVILLGGLLEYLIGILLYKYKLSEYAFRGMFK